MSIRKALRRQSTLASQKRSKGGEGPYGSYAIFIMTAVILAAVLVIEVLRG